jgi:F420-0:gamma-glutamyl ligase
MRTQEQNAHEITKEELQKGDFKFVGFITEKEIKLLKKNKGYVYLKTNSSDIVADVFGVDRSNIYVYKEVLK